MNPRPKTLLTGLPPVHRRTVERLSRGLKPSPAVPPPLAQWGLWAFVSLLATGLALRWFPFRADLKENLASLPFDLLLLCLFGGSLLAAWGAVEGSFPGLGRRGRRKVWGALVLGAGACLLFLFCLPWEVGHYLDHESRLPCFVVVLLTGSLVWFPLVFLLSRNAPLYPARSGFGAGVAAFLMGSGIITLHCDSRDLTHILVEHFLPVLCYSYLLSWASVRWLSRWEKAVDFLGGR